MELLQEYVASDDCFHECSMYTSQVFKCKELVTNVYPKIYDVIFDKTLCNSVVFFSALRTYDVLLFEIMLAQ